MAEAGVRSGSELGEGGGGGRLRCEGGGRDWVSEEVRCLGFGLEVERKSSSLENVEERMPVPVLPKEDWGTWRVLRGGSYDDGEPT